MIKSKQIRRKVRHKRIRAKVSGTLQKPRFFVYKSNKHIYCGLVNDDAGKVLVSFSDIKIKDKKIKNTTKEVASRVGEELAKLAVKGGYKRVVFDRGGYKYHGKIKALADGARKNGLKF